MIKSRRMEWAEKVAGKFHGRKNRKIERPCYGSKDKYRINFMKRNCEVVDLDCDG